MDVQMEVYEGKTFNVDLQSMLGSTNFGWGISKLPEGIILLAVDCIPLTRAIGPVIQRFYFGVCSAQPPYAADMNFSLTCFSNVKDIRDTACVKLQIVPCNDTANESAINKNTSANWPIVNGNTAENWPIVNGAAPVNWPIISWPIINGNAAVNWPIINGNTALNWPIVNESTPKNQPIINNSTPANQPFVNYSENASVYNAAIPYGVIYAGNGAEAYTNVAKPYGFPYSGNAQASK